MVKTHSKVTFITKVGFSSLKYVDNLYEKYSDQYILLKLDGKLTDIFYISFFFKIGFLSLKYFDNL